MNATKARARDAILNGLALYALGLLIMAQVDPDGVQLIDGWHGLKLAMLAIFALALLSWFRAARLIVGD